jgi:hypothetical protein
VVGAALDERFDEVIGQGGLEEQNRGQKRYEDAAGRDDPERQAFERDCERPKRRQSILAAREEEGVDEQDREEQQARYAQRANERRDQAGGCGSGQEDADEEGENDRRQEERRE